MIVHKRSHRIWQVGFSSIDDHIHNGMGL